MSNLPNTVCKYVLFYMDWEDEVVTVAVQLDPHELDVHQLNLCHHRIGRFQHRQLCFSIISRPSFVCINLARLSCFCFENILVWDQLLTRASFLSQNHLFWGKNCKTFPDWNFPFSANRKSLKEVWHQLFQTVVKCEKISTLKY